MTKRKSPREKMVTGSVRSTSTGLIVLFNKARSRATHMALQLSATSIPGRSMSISKSDIADIRIRAIINFICS
jgi:hypothetical protein